MVTLGKHPSKLHMHCNHHKVKKHVFKMSYFDRWILANGDGAILGIE
jgi:hypothetical protein